MKTLPSPRNLFRADSRFTHPNFSSPMKPVSPYIARIEGQEGYIYVWTLGVEGLGDGSDKLVTVDVNPKSSDYGKVIHSYSVGGRHEAHHGGFTDDRKQFWAAGLDTSKIFIFDVRSQPARPQYLKTITDLPVKSGGATGPHGAYALPGRMLIPCLSNSKDRSGRTALVDIATKANTSPRIGCLPRTTRKARRARVRRRILLRRAEYCRARM
jgi:selenium-binding protein 1